VHLGATFRTSSAHRRPDDPGLDCGEHRVEGRFGLVFCALVLIADRDLYGFLD
jgi:hypothetical protein